MPGNGLILLTPTSVTAGTGSATIGANGSVTFSGCTSLTVNGVFSSLYSNYRVILSGTGSSTPNLAFRMASGGTGNAQSSSYISQKLNIWQAQSPSRQIATYSDIGVSGTNKDIIVLDIFYPAVAETTSIRSFNGLSYGNASAFDYGITHAVASSFDGFLWTTFSAFTYTGRISVYGMRG